MVKQYLKQAVQLLKDNKLLSFISIIGTALAITMIMCIVLMLRVRIANYEPEINRDRTLSIKSVVGRNKEDSGWNNGGQLSLRAVKECFYPLTTAEAVTAVQTIPCHVATMDNISETKCIVKATDDSFWKVFGFRFLSGKPYGEEFVSGERKAVISRSLARELFDTDEVVGRSIQISFIEYTICGVVADASVLAENAYAQVWVPYPSLAGYESNYTDGLLGNYACYILAPSAGKMQEVRAEALKNVEQLNANQKDFMLIMSGAPDTRIMSMLRSNVWDEPNVTRYIIIMVVVIVVLLLVPAINLSGITLSRMRRRMEEIGVRRAFGSTRAELMWQVLSENFVVTLIGGVVGLIFSYISILGLREWLLNTTMSGYYGVDTAVSSGMVLSFGVFLIALVFCLLLNLLSAGIPAWRVSRTNIVNALK